MTACRFIPFAALLLILIPALGAYEVTLLGGARLDIPEAWILDDADPAVPSWFSPDRRSAADIMLWEPESFDDLEAFISETLPEGAAGDVMSFPCWDGEAALADWTFTTGAAELRGWFLYVRGTSGPDVKLSAIAPAEDFIERQAFLLSVLDSYIPSDRWRLSPGAVSRFLELSDVPGSRQARAGIDGHTVVWTESAAGNRAAQDVIEREAIVLSSYAGVPELFYPAWERYYRLVYRDSYSRLESLAAALDQGPYPRDGADPVAVAEGLLSWLQGFEYGSVDGYSDLLAPSAACSSATGDCDSLSLVLMMLMDRYGVESRLLLTHQAHHAVTALDLPGAGLRYSDDRGTWLVAELTTPLPLGTLPDRLDGVTDWYGIDLFTE